MEWQTRYFEGVVSLARVRSSRIDLTIENNRPRKRTFLLSCEDGNRNNVRFSRWENRTVYLCFSIIVKRSDLMREVYLPGRVQEETV